MLIFYRMPAKNKRQSLLSVKIAVYLVYTAAAGVTGCGLFLYILACRLSFQ